MISLALFL